ncbi:MAG: hypothetical protein R3E88_06745 [Myxococcota bacterium]
MFRAGSWVAAIALLLGPAAALATCLQGDLDGNGAIDAADESLLAALYGASEGDPAYDPAADANGDAAIDVRDLALFGAHFGDAGGEIDTSAPALVVSLDDVPDDMNDLLVAPPDGFDITLAWSGIGGSIVAPATLSVTSSLPFGALPAGAELAPLFTAGQMGARLAVPAGTDLARTSHYLTVRVADVAGNEAQAVYGFAVRDHPVSGPPLEDEQLVWLDFTRDRSLGPEVDFVEDLRTFHLTSTAAPLLEPAIRDWVIAEVVARANVLYGRNPDGSAAPGSANLRLVAAQPAAPPYSRLCVGGASQLGAPYLGATLLDVNNVVKAQDECALGSFFGVFPQALDDLWAADPEFQAVFDPLDPAHAGTPIGEHALDAIVLDVAFDPQLASGPALARWNAIETAVTAFAQAIASAAAHETGHLVGLVAHGATPGGLFGGASGGAYDHNVTPSGATPGENFLMNQGASFTFAEITGRAGEALPRLRPLAWAYLHNALVLDARVTALYPAPALAAANPPAVALGGGAASVTFTGTGFVATPALWLVDAQTGSANEVLGEAWLDAGTVTGTVNALLVPPGTYDVQLVNPDGQVATLPAGLVVQ